MMPARRFGAVSIALGLMLASACASARAADAYRADPKLVEAARKEGEVVVYTTLIVDQIVRPMIKAFTAAVPGIDVKYVRADGLALELRMSNEMRAGRVQSDVWCMVERVWNPKSMPAAWGFIATAVRYMGEEQGMAYLHALAKQEVVPLPMAIRA